MKSPRKTPGLVVFHMLWASFFKQWLLMKKNVKKHKYLLANSRCPFFSMSNFCWPSERLVPGCQQTPSFPAVPDPVPSPCSRWPFYLICGTKGGWSHPAGMSDLITWSCLGKKGHFLRRNLCLCVKKLRFFGGQTIYPFSLFLVSTL